MIEEVTRGNLSENPCKEKDANLQTLSFDAYFLDAKKYRVEGCHGKLPFEISLF